MSGKHKDHLPWPIPHEAMHFAGYRAMREMAAKRPESIGYGALGMYLFSHAMWLADEVRRGGFDRVVFLARDGFYVKEAFDRVKEALALPVETSYVRISRQAAFPLHFRTPDDLDMLPVWVDYTAHTPHTLLRLFAPVLPDRDAGAVMAAAGLPLDQSLTEQTWPVFRDAYRAHLWDAVRVEAYGARAAAYLSPHFTGRCATFDVGYNLRSESVIGDMTGADITAFITHTDSDVPDHRGVPYRTLYGASPYVSWVAREQFLLEDAPCCVGYDGNGPVLEAEYRSPSVAVRACQQEALVFVEDMVRTCGANLRNMPFRPADGCAAFEHFLHCARRREMLPFKENEVENDFHNGAVEDDSVFLQWRLMQTDYRAAVTGEAAAITRARRALIRLRENPGSFLRKLERKSTKSHENSV
ncbi:MAG: hypothetical protein IJ438_13100 [Clostridia bacterium]|nr:hypothetical protein [Clostridia bacterium]